MCMLMNVIDYVYIVGLLKTGVTGVTTMKIKIAFFILNIVCMY